MLTCTGWQLLPAQTYDYGNSWIDHNQQYARFRVAEDAIYRVTRNDLLAAGVNLTGLNPDHIHLTWRGEEQHIHVETSGGQLDFIEFFGHRNDGLLDTAAYVHPYTGQNDPNQHPNPRLSTFSDTSTYFFHFDNAPGLRLTTVANTNFTSAVPESSYRHESYVEFHPDSAGAYYHFGGGAAYDIFHILNSHWITGEGFVGPGFAPLAPLNLTFETPYATNQSPANLFYRVLGSSSWQHILDAKLNSNLLRTDSVNGVYVDTYSATHSGTLNSTTTLELVARGTQNNGTDNNRLCAASLVYDHATNLGNGNRLGFRHYTPTSSYFRFENADIDTMGVVYDLDEHKRYLGIAEQDSFKVLLDAPLGVSSLFLSTDRGLKTPEIRSDDGLAHLSTHSGAEMILITDRALSASAEAYAAYRDSSAVHPVSTQVVYMEEIYHEFNWGSASPLAIKRFCKYAIDQWSTRPDYLLLWGKARSGLRHNPDNLVPTYGYPAADHMFAAYHGYDTLSPVPELAVGRVPCTTNEQGLTYLAKVQTYENAPAEPWMQNTLVLSGGNGTVEQWPIRTYADVEFIPEVISAPEYGRALHYWQLDTIPDSNTTVATQQAISDGVKVISWFGHATSNIYDIPLYEPEDYANWDRLPMLLGMGCYGGDFTGPGMGYGERWLFATGRGAIAVLANTSAGFLTPLGDYGRLWYKKMFTEMRGESVGEIVVETMREYFGQWDDQLHQNSAHQMALLGDPALVLYTPDFSVWPGDANNDRIANQYDLLTLGLAYGDTGAARPNASNAWAEQTAFPWATDFPDGTNHANADCNGDGEINQDDTLAIQLNYGLTHNRVGGNSGTNDDPDLFVESPTDSLEAGERAELYVHLGDPIDMAQNVYGIGFSILYDANLVDPDSITIAFDTCWIGTQGQNLIALTHHFPAQGQLDVALTRTDHQPVTGAGVIARIGIVVIDNISGKREGGLIVEDLEFRIVQTIANDAAGNRVPLFENTTTIVVHDADAAATQGPAPKLAPGTAFAAYPNPATEVLHLLSEAALPVEATLFQADGKAVRHAQFAAGDAMSLQVADLPAGTYLLHLRNAKAVRTLKVRIGD
ncbi:MAG: C25 family cysteine peptidase [Bacteroidota bacterium]